MQTHPITLSARDVTRAIVANQHEKDMDMLVFVALCDTYGISEVARWLRNHEANLSAALLSPGTAGDPRR